MVRRRRTCVKPWLDVGLLVCCPPHLKWIQSLKEHCRGRHCLYKCGKQGCNTKLQFYSWRGPVVSRPQDSQEPSSRKQDEGDRDRDQGESPDCCHHCHGVIPVMILLLISADNWGLHGDGENGEDDLSHTISLQLDIYWILTLSTSPHQPQLNITHW